MEVAWWVLLAVMCGLGSPVLEVEVRTAPIPCQFPEIQSLPGAKSAALARGKAWKQSGFGMSL